MADYNAWRKPVAVSQSNNGPQIIEQTNNQSNYQSNNQSNYQSNNQSNNQPGTRFWNSSNNQRSDRDRFPPSNGQPNDQYHRSNYPTINQSNHQLFQPRQQQRPPRPPRPPRQWSNVVRKPNDYNANNQTINHSNNQTVDRTVIESNHGPASQPGTAKLTPSVQFDSLLVWLCVDPHGKVIVRVAPDSLKRAADRLHLEWVDDYKRKLKSLSNQSSEYVQSHIAGQPADELLEHLSDTQTVDSSLVHHHIDLDCRTCNYFESSLTSYLPTRESADVRESIVDRVIQLVIRSMSRRRVTVSRAGSNATNTNFAHSDIDLTIMDQSNNPPSEKETRSSLRIVSDRFLREFPAGSVECVLNRHARIPLIRMVVPLKELPTVTDQQSKKVSREQFNAKAISMLAPGDRCSIDLKWGNELDASKTALLIEFLACDSRVRPALLTVKWIAQAREINDARQQTFNSYSLMLMFIFVMQHVVQPPVLPIFDELDLKMIASERSGLRGSLALSWQERLSESQINKMSVNALVCSFFRFFATQFRPQYDAIDVVRGLQQRALCVARNDRYEIVPSLTGCQAEPRAAFVVVDPYTKEDNASRAVTHLALPRIMDEFRRAHRILSQARSHGQSCCSHEIWAQLTAPVIKEPTTKKNNK